MNNRDAYEEYERDRLYEEERFDDRFWLVLREPRKSPELKGPFRSGIMPLAHTLREFMADRPRSLITVLTITSSGPLVEDGPQALEIADGRSHPVAANHRRSSLAAFADAAVGRKQVP